jgi:hypothetical protein
MCTNYQRKFTRRTPLSCHGRRKDLKIILLKHGARLSNVELLGFHFDIIHSVGGRPFVFKTILKHKLLGDPMYRQRVEYLVDWKDHPPTWEPSNMFKSMQSIYDYHSRTKTIISKDYGKAVNLIRESGQTFQPDDFLAFRMESLNVQLG